MQTLSTRALAPFLFLLGLLARPAPTTAQSLAFDRVLPCASGDGPYGWGPVA